MLDANLPPPDGLIAPEGSSAERRFSVYRNTVVASLTEALFAAFPVIAKLIGDANFRVLATAFLRQHPPESPVLMAYGRAMPDFLTRFDPARALPYLPDVARLECAVRHAYHAADATPLPAEALPALPPDQLLETRLSFAPALQVIHSDWPIASIWRRNMIEGCPKPITQPETALVTRPGFDPIVTALSPAGGIFVEALRQNATFGAAFDAAREREPEFDLTVPLRALGDGGAMTGFSEGTTP